MIGLGIAVINTISKLGFDTYSDIAVKCDMQCL